MEADQGRAAVLVKTLEKPQVSENAEKLRSEADRFEPLIEGFACARTVREKLALLDALPDVREFLATRDAIQNMLSEMEERDQLVVKAVLAIGQGDTVFGDAEMWDSQELPMQRQVRMLKEMETFYEGIGGIVGYHVTLLRLIADQENPTPRHSGNTVFHRPEGIDIAQSKNEEVKKAILWGLEHLEEMAEIYPVGGAGDRLNLCDEATGKALPVAMLRFCGRTLLEGLIRDVQAREYLAYKLFGKQITTPLAMMTSQEKDNHVIIESTLKDNQWFGRSPASFFLFQQALVPVITKEGKWSASRPGKLTVKPGGHGVMWKVALDQGLFDWLKQNRRHKALVRQINNPIAGVDHGLLAFAGIGLHHDKTFGFASCPRVVKTAEGMNVLVEVQTEQGYRYCLTNIEYTDFTLNGIEDISAEKGSNYSAFPTNTNILFADLNHVAKLCRKHPAPGMLVNLKKKSPQLEPDGTVRQVEAGRLESMMQNIADHIENTFDEPLDQKDRKNRMNSYLTYHDRIKTISVTKSTHVAGQSILGTPEGSFYDLMQNMHDLLANYCGVRMPSLNTHNEYLDNGPSFVVLLHPAFGPLFTVIAQKIRGGVFTAGSEMQLEIADAYIEDFRLSGSLIVEADSVMGTKDGNGVIRYGENTGKCVLRHVTIINEGIDRGAKNVYWKNEISRRETLHIVLQGNGEFYAENVTFQGGAHIIVPNNTRMIAYQDGENIQFRSEKLSTPNFHFHYSIDQKDKQIRVSVHS